MAFENVQPKGNDKETIYYKAKNMEEGQVFEGFFKNKYTDTTSKYGPSTTFYIEGEEVTYGINAVAHIKFLFGDMEPGPYVRLTYKGQKDIGKAQPAHQFKLEIDNERSQ